MGLEKLTENNLAQFYGSENYYRTLIPKVFYTDGAKFLKDNGASWLIDDIAAFQLAPEIRANKRLAEFQLWEFKVNEGRGVLTCRTDSDKPQVIEKEYITDFPLSEIALYCNPSYTEESGECRVILLTSEY